MSESDILRRILSDLGSRPDIRLWRNNVGVGRALSNGAIIRYGLIGSADLTGILKVGTVGVSLWIETKTSRGRLSLQQKRFAAMVIRMGGCYIVARSLEDANAGIEDFKTLRRVRASLSS